MDTITGVQLARYLRLRAVLKDLHNTLVNQLPRHALQNGGMALGIYKKGTLVFGSEDEASVLMDYCIYDYRWDGQNVIERYIRRTPPQAGSDEKVLLDAMLQARYSLLVVDEVVKGVGIQTHDLFRGDDAFIVDVGMSNTAWKGFAIACRIITPTPGESGFSMTTGAGLPADRSILERIKKEVPQRFGRTPGDVAHTSLEKPAEFSAAIIRIFLEGDASSSIRYADPVPETTARTGPRVGRNELCPCGSGKKYKKCCGKASET